MTLERPRDLRGIVAGVFALYRLHWLRLMAVAAVACVPVDVAVFGVGLGWLTGGYESTLARGTTVLAGLAQLLVTIPLAGAMTTHLVRDGAPGGGGASARRAIAAGLGDFSVLVLPVALAGVAVFAGSGLIFLGPYLLVRFAMVPQAVVVEDRRGVQALARSWELSYGRGWLVLGAAAAAMLVSVLVGYALALPFDAAAESADAQGLVLLGQILAEVLTLPVLMLTGVVLYHSLLAEEEGRGAAEEPPDPPPPAGWQPPV